jgi:hypothetical protein
MPDHIHLPACARERNLSGASHAIHQGRIFVSSEGMRFPLAATFHESSHPRLGRLRAASRLHPDESCASTAGTAPRRISVFVSNRCIEDGPGPPRAKAPWLCRSANAALKSAALPPYPRRLPRHPAALPSPSVTVSNLLSAMLRRGNTSSLRFFISRR